MDLKKETNKEINNSSYPRLKMTGGKGYTSKLKCKNPFLSNFCPVSKLLQPRSHEMIPFL